MVVASIITLTRYDAWTLKVMVDAARGPRKLQTNRDAAASARTAPRGWRGHGSPEVLIELTEAERDPAEMCWEVVTLVE